jgi:hypothetical protein
VLEQGRLAAGREEPCRKGTVVPRSPTVHDQARSKAGQERPGRSGRIGPAGATPADAGATHRPLRPDFYRSRRAVTLAEFGANRRFLIQTSDYARLHPDQIDGDYIVPLENWYGDTCMEIGIKRP